MEKIIMKIGTAVLSDEKAADPGVYLQKQIDQILSSIVPHLDPRNQQLVIVSSGAVGMGRQLLKPIVPLSLQDKQICASVGQVLLMKCYQNSLSKNSYQPAQILLTSETFSNPKMKGSLLGCLKGMAGKRIVPIVNENDVISTEELAPNPKDPDQEFSDNDHLSSLLAEEVRADLLILLTEGKGIYKNKPKKKSDPPISLIRDVKELDEIETWQGSASGRGGIESKISSIARCMKANIPCWITSGSNIEGLGQLFQNWRARKIPTTGTFVLGKEGEW